MEIVRNSKEIMFGNISENEVFEDVTTGIWMKIEEIFVDGSENVNAVRLDYPESKYFPPDEKVLKLDAVLEIK